MMQEENFNNYIERIEKNCEQSLDELFLDYSDFLLWNIEEWDYDFPETASKMFELFKQSTAKYHFHREKRDFLLSAGVEHDIDSINAELLKLENIVSHPRLRTYEDQMHLFNEAKYQFSIGAFQDVRVDSTLHIYYLLKYGYFNKYLLPERYLSVESSDDSIGKVYGRYIMLYEYLQNEKKAIADGEIFTLNLQSVETIVVKDTNQGSAVKAMKRQYFEDIWEATPRKMYYKTLMDELCKLEIEGRNIVTLVNGKYYWAQDWGKGKKTYLAAFFYECDRAKFLDGSKYGGSKPIIRAILGNTFNIDAASSDPFENISKDKSGKFDEYKRPFRNLIDSIIKDS